MPNKGVSEEIYEQYALKEDVRPGDILIVRDGTYLVGTSCLITEYDQKMLYCGGLIKIRVLKRIFLMNIFCLDFEFLYRQTPDSYKAVYP